jgi:hypothetical protein
MPIRAANLFSLLILPLALGLSFLAGWQLRGEPQQVDQVVNPPALNERLEPIPMEFPRLGS